MDFSRITHAEGSGLLWGLANGLARRFVMNFAGGFEPTYEQLIDPDFWAEYSDTLAEGDVVIITSLNYTVELGIVERLADGFRVKLLSAQFHYSTSGDFARFRSNDETAPEEVYLPKEPRLRAVGGTAA